MKNILIVLGETKFDHDAILGMFSDDERGLEMARNVCFATLKLKRFDDICIRRAPFGVSLENAAFKLVENY